MFGKDGWICGVAVGHHGASRQISYAKRAGLVWSWRECLAMVLKLDGVTDAWWSFHPFAIGDLVR